MSWKRFNRVCCRTIGVILLIVLAILLYLSIWGVPRRYLDRLQNELKSAGYFITVERIHLNLLEGIDADQIRIFEDEHQVLPMLDVKRVAVSLNPLDWLRGEPGLRCLRVHDGLLRLSLADSPTTDNNETIILRHINIVLHFHSNTLDLKEFSADLIGLPINAHGVILMPPAKKKTKTDTPPAKVEPEIPLPRQVGTMVRSYREQILEIVHEVNAIHFNIAPSADITFRIDTDKITASQGAIRLEGATTRAFGIQLDQWQFHAEMKDRQVHLSNVRLQQKDQYLACSGTYDMESGDYKGRYESSFNPRLLAPLLGSNQAEMVNTFICHGSPPAIEVNFSGRVKDNDAIWAAGQIHSSNFTYQTVPITSFGIQFGYTNKTLALDTVSLVLAEGELTSNFKVYLDKSTAEIDVVSTVNPLSLVRLAGPEIAAHLDGCHFSGPTRIAARGCIDYGSNMLTDIQAEIDGTHCGYAPLDVDSYSLKAGIKQLRLDLTDINIELYEGTLSGKASLYPASAATNSPTAQSSSRGCQYDVSAKVNDINLNTLLQSLGYKGMEELEGLIYAECVVAGLIDKARGNPISGGGWVRIQDGQLFQLHLLADLSRIISTIRPGIGTISMTDFGVNFKVEDQKIHGRDLVLSGPDLSIHGEGYYAFDNSIDFVVWVQPPKGKSLMPELSKVTTPFLAKFLAVRLTGTVSNPKWWPLNMTKDQLMTMPKDMLITMPKDVLVGLPNDLLVNLPKEVLVTLPHRILIDLPREIFITLPKKLWRAITPSHPEKAAP